MHASKREEALCVGALGRSEMDFALSEVAVRYGQIIAGLVQQRRMITGFIVSRRHNQPYLMSLIQHTHCHLIYGLRWLSLPRSGFIMAAVLLEFFLLYTFFLFSITVFLVVDLVQIQVHLCWTQGHAQGLI